METQKVKETQPATTSESFEDVLHHFLTLHERWGEERQVLAKQNAELGKLVTRLSAQVEKLKEADGELRKQVSNSIIESSYKMAERTSKEFKKETMQDVEEAARELRRASQDTTQHLRQLHQEQASGTIYFIIGLFVLPIVVSLLIYVWLSPKPLLPMTDQQFSTYQDGQLLDGFWSKLNKKQQKFLTQLGNGEINNHGKRLDEMQDTSSDNNNNEGYTGN